MKLNKRICIGLLALLIIFHAVNNYLILNNDTTTYSARNALHYLQSIKIRDSPLRIAIMEGYGYPPLYYWSTLPMYLFFGISQDIAARTNIIYFIILIFAVYGIGKELGNRETGLLSALIVSTFCSIFAYSRVYSIDFCLVPLVALAVYFLIKTKELTNRKYSILFGAACGLGMLLKWNFSIYIIGPALYYIIKSFFFSKLIIKKRKLEKKNIQKRLLNILVAGLVLILLASIWYPFNINILERNSKYYSEQYSEGQINNINQELGYDAVSDQSKNNLELPAFYLNELWIHQIGYVYFILFFISATYLLFISKKKHLILFFWIIIPYLILTLVYVFSNAKECRFTIPYLPACGIIIALMISSLKPVRMQIPRKTNRKTDKKSGLTINIKKIIVAIIIALAFTQFFIISYGNAGLFIDDEILTYNNRHLYGMIQSNRVDWKDKAITESIYFALTNYSDQQVQLALFLEHNQFSSKDFELNMLSYKKELKHKNITFWCHEPYGLCGLGQCNLNYSFYEDTIIKSQFIVADNFSGERNFASTAEYRAYHYMETAIINNKDKFILIEKFQLPTEKSLYLYKRKDFEND